ncbi:MAG: NfeD family protein [Desulfobacteraceae bacterium]|nr:NfeD family protein [Desulfobacteraceae bacterium]
MEFRPAYWHWLVIGIILMLAEIFLPSFTIFWFGLSAIALGVILMLFAEITLNWQLFIWTVASCLMTFVWFKFFKPFMKDRTKAGIAMEAIIGQTGRVIIAPAQGFRGCVRFSVPLLGDDEWSFICKQNVAIGDLVIIRDISGNTLVVDKVES